MNGQLGSFRFEQTERASPPSFLESVTIEDLRFYTGLAGMMLAAMLVGFFLVFG